MIHRLPLIAALLVAPLCVSAQEPDFGNRVGATPDLIFTLRGGVASTPEYFGSENYQLGPDLGFSLGYLRLPGGRSIGNPDPLFESEGLSLRGSFLYIGERDEQDGKLEGLDDVDSSVELGAGVAYSTRTFEAFADLRYGVIGHNTFVGELGADLKVRPTDQLTMTFGPRVLLGTDTYADTYFGITDDEAANSDFDAYDADGGLISAGLELGASYRLNRDWGIEGAVTYDRLTADADDSPIVEDRDQYGIRLGITRQITLDF